MSNDGQPGDMYGPSCRLVADCKRGHQVKPQVTRGDQARVTRSSEPGSRMATFCHNAPGIQDIILHIFVADGTLTEFLSV